ncbi:enoyl-CoA hydratase/isomerase family protein [Pseudonocardia sp. UM4_GMWB1]|uniref:enoyl-CoA hydratase/isomerase family protein n=1 Tax=Pseudonocardia sp. UM4_GMWB1 TaxID=2212989 RepID=UPI00307CF968
MRKPTVAALNGWAMGGGCELALACDVRLAAEHARIGLPEAKRGMGANFGVHLLSRIVPRGIAYELLYTGDDLSAADAHRWGLVNRVVSGAALAAEADALARRIAGNAPLTVQRYKAAIGAGRGAAAVLGAAPVRRPGPLHQPGPRSRGWPRSWRSGRPSGRDADPRARISLFWQRYPRTGQWMG